MTARERVLVDVVMGRLCVAVDVGLGHGMSVCFSVVILDLIQDLFRLRGFGWNGVTDTMQGC